MEKVLSSPERSKKDEEEEEIIMESDVIVSTLFQSIEDVDEGDLGNGANRPAPVNPSQEDIAAAAHTELAKQLNSSDVGSSDEDGILYDSDGEVMFSPHLASKPKSSKIPQELLQSQKMIRSK